MNLLPGYWPGGGEEGVLGLKVKGTGVKEFFGFQTHTFRIFFSLIFFGIVSSYQGFCWVLTKMGRFMVKICYGPFSGH